MNVYRHYPQFLTEDNSSNASYRDDLSRSDCSKNVPDIFQTSPTASLHSLCAQLSINSFPSSIRSTHSSLQFSMSEISEDSSTSTGSHSSEEQLIIRKACRFDCYCSCHPMTQLQPQNGVSFQRPFSHLSLSFAGCDDPRCESAKSAEEAAGFTSGFFQKTLSHVMSSHSVKVRYNLNTFHIVPEGSEIMRYTKQGNLDSLKLAIQSGQATIWDTAPDGWSLLHVSGPFRRHCSFAHIFDRPQRTIGNYQQLNIF